ncbi:transcription factor-like 5 protein [Hyla sarda]|uniref:transcription factor-like 5 protein n=1 Tax=Hyla sarda TaxID=327740 RepID=UPI0024C2AD4B|nr:transcription factor-like 5 protein [Hyla sarda]
MSEPTQAHPTTSVCPAGLSDFSTPAGEGVVNEQATNLSIVELTDIEYTQLQQLLFSHIDSQSNELDADTRMSPFFTSNAPQYQSTSLTTSSVEGHNVHQVKCPSAVSTDNNIVHANQTLGHVDFQQLRMMMVSETIFPPPSCNLAEQQPIHISGDSSGAVPMQLGPTCGVIELNKENMNIGDISEPRKSSVRVRLEDRFSSLPTDVPRCTEVPKASVTMNNLMTIIHHPSQITGTLPPGNCTPIVKNHTAQSSLQTACSGNNLQNTTLVGNTDSSLKQTRSSLNCGASCPLLEAARNQEISLSRGLSFCCQQDIQSFKQDLGLRNTFLPEEILIKVEDTSCKESVKKRSRIHLTYANMERRVLSDISNTCQRVNWAPTQGKAAEQGSDSKQTGLSQRRERHNRMERDRRRRIRVSCDELNNLVPFCSIETDKATTLHWTVAYLKYIQERHGDTIKKEFEAVSVARTESELKVTTRSASALEATVGSRSLQDVK